MVWTGCYSLSDTQMKNPNLWSHCMRVVCLNFSKLKLIILRLDKTSFIQDFPCYIDCASYKFKYTHIRIHCNNIFFFSCMTSSHVSPCLVHMHFLLSVCLFVSLLLWLAARLCRRRFIYFIFAMLIENHIFHYARRHTSK